MLALSMLVSPSQHIVGEGALVSFDCLVIGHPVANITWARDFGDLNTAEVNLACTTVFCVAWVYMYTYMHLATYYLIIHGFLFHMQESIKVANLGEERQGLKLTFLSSGLLDSGYYVCTALNEFEKVQQTVELAVHPAGNVCIPACVLSGYKLQARK